jgi:distribution and morphology protein 31
MQVTRSLLIGRSTLPRASSSRMTMRSPSADRYLAIHAFFTRQASSHPIPHRFPRHTSTTRIPRRFNSTRQPDPPKPCAYCPSPPPPPPPPPPPASTTRGHAQDYTPFIRRLIHRTQTISHNSPHRPTKEELLAAASSFWERLRIRMKWFFIRGWRRFNTDDLSAFASWFVVGNSKFWKPLAVVSKS